MKFWLAVSALLMLSGCVSLGYTTANRQGEMHAPGEKAEARVGEVMLNRFDYTSTPAIIPEEVPSAVGRPAVEKGARLVGYAVNNETGFCKRYGSTILCFFDDDDDGKIDSYRSSNGLNMWGSKANLAAPIPYKVADLNDDSSGYKYELIYQGISDNVLNVSYREYVDSMARPAFQQDLRYTLKLSGPTEITFRSAKLRVFSADNDRISFEVLTGL